VITTIALAGLLLLITPTTSLGEPLDQTVAPDEPISKESVTITKGHVDIGPRFVDDTWSTLVRDDSVVPAAWRLLPDVVMQVVDGPGQIAVPDDPAYTFLGQPPGTMVHVIPQTQDPEVVWVGWNTQDPQVVKKLGRGATLRLRGVNGPGTMIVFMQDGGFTEPRVLWDSRQQGLQDIWMEPNTHTHANWVFSTPGVYLAEVEVLATLKDGTAVSDRQLLRFAVGSATDVEQARTAEYVQPGSAPTDAPTAVPAPGDSSEGSAAVPLAPILIGVIIVLLVVIIAILLTVARSRRAKALAEADADTDGPQA
jgi:surface-anchored protein